MFDARRGPAPDFHFTDERIEAEQLAVGDAVTVNFLGNLAYTPVRAGTVVITDGTQTATDDGNGNLVGDVNPAGTNTVTYGNGAYNVTFAAAPAAGLNVTADYEVNFEGNANTPELDLVISSSPVVARPNKLRLRWSVEAQQDLQAYHGVNAEAELVAFGTNEVMKEINYKIIRHIASIAAAGNVQWDRTPPANVQWFFHKNSLYDLLVQQSNLVFRATQRVVPNWIVAGIEVCNVIEVLDKFQKAGGGGGDAGVRKIGTLGNFDVYKDPSFGLGAGDVLTHDQWLMGYKGGGMLDTGYIWAPYLPLYVTPTIVLDDMLARKALAQRSGQKVVNANFYSIGTLVQTGAPF